MANPNMVLVLTVGTGNKEKIEESLLTPLSKSIQKGKWATVVLIPSLTTKVYADQLVQRFKKQHFEVIPIPEHGHEEDTDLCFAHFNNVIRKLRVDGFKPQEICVDFTRGTKAMSAALVLAAVTNELPQLRYIRSSQRDERGMVSPGHEIVDEFATDQISVCQRIDDAIRLCRRGNFASAMDILPSIKQRSEWPKQFIEVISYIRALARFYVAWDRLNYEVASNIRIRSLPEAWIALGLPAPTDEVKSWINELGSRMPTTHAGRQRRLSMLAIDLYANGQRRIRSQMYEDAIIRAFRVVELLIDVGLLANGFDPRKIENQRGGIREKLDELRKRNSSLEKNLRNLYSKTRKRNDSILTHGHTAAGGPDQGFLKMLYPQIEVELFRTVSNELETMLKTARFIDSFRDKGGMPLALIL